MTSTRNDTLVSLQVEEGSFAVNVYWIAAVWLGMALLASLISIRVGISVALVEIVVAAVIGNIPGSDQLVEKTDFTAFLATFGSVVLTVSCRRGDRPGQSASALAGRLSSIWCGQLRRPVRRGHAVQPVSPWDGTGRAAEIAGVALSTTSVAVVYAVMVESGLNRADIGKLILAACFVTDLGTVLALGGLFTSLSWTAAAVRRRDRRRHVCDADADQDG